MDRDEDPRRDCDGDVHDGGDGDAGGEDVTARSGPGGDGISRSDGDGISPSGGDDAAIAAVMSSLFDTMLTDEPPSAVTPLTVLRKAHLDQQDRRNRRVAAVRRWGGGLVAAAAVIAAVVLLGPSLLNRSAPSAGSGSVPVAAGAGTCASGSAPTWCTDAGTRAAGPSVSSAGGASSGSGYGSDAGGAGSGGSAGSGVGGGSAEGAPAAPGRDSSAAAGSASGTAGASESSAASSAAASGSGAQAPSAHTGGDGLAATEPAVPGGGSCDLLPLLPANRDAAVSALPADVLTGVASVDRCRPGDVRGTTLELIWPDSSVTVVLSRTADCGTCSGAEDVPPSATTAGGSVTTWAGRDGVTVTVTANPAAAAHLSQEQLAGIVTAVLDSNR